MTVSIVGVHGINCYRYYRSAGTPEGAGSLLAADWTTALTEGAVLPPEATAGRLAVAYYSHLLRRRATAQGPDDLKWLDPAEQAVLSDLLRDLGAPEQVAQGERTVRARQAGHWLERHVPLVGTAAVAVFCREVDAYLGSGSRRRESVVSAVAAAIAWHRPRVVVAHSLGSVVAYETLWAHRELAVDLLLTLGSPLGMPRVIQRRLTPLSFDAALARGARPPSVRRWVNVADQGDLVADTGGLDNSYDGVTQLPDITIGETEFHAATAYLRHPDVAAHLAPYL